MYSRKPSQVDVLIIGAGPTGLMSGTWLSRLGVSIRMIDKRSTRALAGRADGLMARTLEIMDSFKLGDAVRATGCMIDDFVVWAPDDEGNTHRVDRQPVWGSETSFIKPYTVHQGHIEAVFLDGLKRGQTPVEVERAVEPIDMKIDSTQSDNLDAYPITVTVKHLSEAEADYWPSNAHTVLPDGSTRTESGTNTCTSVADGAYQTQFQKSDREGETETIQAKFVIGCEGAHSWVRRHLGIEMVGQSTESLWGVMDIVPITNYPDIRRQGPIVASKHEPIVNIPRENGLNRIYVPLSGDYAEKNSIADLEDPSRAVCRTIISVARDALKPYTLDYEYCDWYTLYKVGRRSASAYADPTNRVFIAGDACHTHTPKGGQGMNVSVQDAHNLGWKIAGVLKGQLRPEVLATYEVERRPIGKRLVEIDEALSKSLSGAADDKEPLMNVYDLLRRFADGRAVVYGPNVAIAEESKDSGLRVGTRIYNHYVRAQATSYSAQTIELLPSDGRWRLVVYGGDVSRKTQLESVNRLGAAISGSGGLVDRYQSITPAKPWLELLLIHASELDAVDMQSFHEAFRPRHEEHGGTSWLQIWADARVPLQKTSAPPGEAHRTLGIDPEVGAMAMVRPDAFVGWAGRLEDLGKLEEYCAGVFAGPL